MLPMSFAWSKTAIVAIALAGVFAIACSTTADEPQGASEADLSATTFDKNNVLDDATFRDARAVDTAEIQRFLEKTPFKDFFLLRTTSPLATYRDGGKLASEILSATAAKYALNPIELLVAIEAEQSLVSATALDGDAAKLAFRCGCPDGDECKLDPSLYIGFTKQAECYGATMRAAMDAQKAGNATKTGWKRGAARIADDQAHKILVTPANMATAALYSYTPFVGKGGGGDATLGGVSKHWELFNRFGKALSYQGPPGAADGGTPCATSAECASDTPVCNTAIRRCVACAADYRAAAAPPRACPDVDLPACAPSGACVQCSATNATVCAKTTTTPACVAAESTCGCTDDASCGAGKICSPALGPAGMCSEGCRVKSGKDSCGPSARCSKTNGSVGACETVTCETQGCPTGLLCDTTGAPSRCVECTTTQTAACSAKGAGAACVDRKCGCATDADCGGAGRTCDTAAHACKAAATTPDAGVPPDPTGPPQAPPTGQPPSGHGTTDPTAPPKVEPQFAPLTGPPSGAGVGCHTSSRSGGSGAAGALALAVAALAFARRARRRPTCER